VTIFSFTLFLGLFSVYDIVVDDDVPEVLDIGYYSREKTMARFNTTKVLYFQKELNSAECWERMQPTLQILEKTCPEAADWVRDRHVKGKIVWETGKTEYYAKYDYVSKVLTWNQSSFASSDGIKATILAHEFRHSLQNFSKFFRSIVAAVIFQDGKESIVEDDAYLFEHKVLVAIFL